MSKGRLNSVSPYLSNLGFYYILLNGMCMGCLIKL